MKCFFPLFIGFNFIRLSQSQETVWYLSAQDWPAFKDVEAKKLTTALGVSYESDINIIIGNILQRNLFLTLESKGSLPSLFRPMMGNGLSICMWAALVPNIKVPNDNRAYFILQERVKMNTEMVYVQLSINVDGGIKFSMENSIRKLFATTQDYYVPRDGTFVYICTRYKKTQNFPFAEENIMEIWVNGKVRKVSKKSIQQHKENDEEMAITIGDPKKESLPWKFAIMTIVEKYSEQFCCSPFGCQSKPCLNGGKCVPTYISSLSFTCFCVGLYGGNLCQDKLSACQLEPCKRGGTCENLPEDKFKCHCPANAFGDLCENEKIIPDPTKMSDLHLMAQSESLYPGEQAKFLFILAQIGIDASFQKRLIFRPTSQEQPSSPIGFPVFANTTEGLREFPHVPEDLVNSEYGFFYSIFNETLTQAGSYKIDITGKTKNKTVHQISVIVKVFETLTGFQLKTASTKTEVNVSFPIILVSTEKIPTRSYTRWRGVGKTWEEWTNFKPLAPTDPYRKKISTTFGNNVRLPLTTVYIYERNVVLTTVGQETLMVELVNKTENKTMERTIATIVNIVSMKYFDVVPKFQIAHENKLFEMISITPLDLGTQPEIEWRLSDGQKIVQGEPTVKNCKKCIQDALKPEEFKNLILPKDFYTYTVEYSFDMPGDYTAVVTVRNMAYVIFTVTVNITVIQPMSEIRLLTKDNVVNVGKRTAFLAVIHRPGTEPSIIWDIGSEVSQPDAELIRYGKTVDDELMEVLNPVDLEAFREGCFYQIKWHTFDSDGNVTLKAIGQNMKIPQRSDKLEVEVVNTISGLKMFVSDTIMVVNKILTVVFTIVNPTPTTSFILIFGDTDRQTVTELKYSNTVKPIEHFIGLMKTDYDELTAKGFFYKLIERKITKLGLTKIRLEVYIEDIQKTVMTANIHAVEIICSPNVTVTNVAQNISESVTYHRKDVIRFGVETTIKCTHRQLKSREWSLFKITSPANSTSVQKTKVKLANSINTTSEILEIPGNTLLFGQYFLQLKVIITQAETTGESFGSGYFDIILSPLRAVIVGGESRALSVKETLVLDGSESINPNGDKIFYTWSCSSESAIILKNICGGFTHPLTEKDPIISFRPGMFLPETNYTFKLTVRGSFPEEKASSVKQIIVMGIAPSIQVTCLRNCKQEVNPKEILVLEATCFHYGSLEFTWNIFKINKEGTEENFPWVPCSDNGKKGDTLYLKTGCLHLRKRYIAKVTGKQPEISSQSLATYAFTVGAPPGHGTCDFTPKVGESLLTKFEVICDGFRDEDGPLTYQIFYENGINVADTHVSSKLTESYVGILLHKRYDQGSKNMYVPIGNPKSNYTGQITIAISDYFGISTMINYTIQVFPPKSLTKRQLEKIVLSHDEGSIHDLLMFAGDVEGAVNLAKCVADILNSEALPHVTDEDRSMFRKELIEILQKIPQQGFGFASETLETINYILHTSSEEIDAESSGVAVEIMEKIALNLTTNIVKDNVQTQLIYDTAINAFSAAASLMSVSAGVEPFHTKIQSENITVTENEEKEKRCAVSSKLLKVVDDISDALLTTSTRGEEDLHLSSNSIGVWLRKSDTSHNMGEVIGHGDAVKLPPISALDMNDSSKLNLDIKMVSSPFNPYACSEDGDLINTHTVSLAIDALSRKSRKELSIQRTNESLIEVFLKRRAQPESVQSNVTTEGFPDDFFIRFHTTEIKTPGVTIHIQIDRENTNYSFLLTWNYDCLPQKQQFMETPYILPSTNKNKSFLLTLDSDSNETLQVGEYALGILPYTTSIAPSLGRNDSELAFDDSQGPVTIFYNLTIFVSRCMYYDDKKQKWSDKGCKVGPKTDETVVHCICSHLSLFSASFLVAPNTVDVTKTIELFRTAKDNFVVIGFMIGSWLIYFCLLGYAIKKDRDDAKMKHTVVLQDNKPTELYPYIIQVFTGIRIDAGTSATVQIQLHGSRLTSRVRTLISPNRPLFQTGGEDWFLLKTDGSLGQIRGITISHDNGGKYPNWYLSQIKLMDPEAGRSWLFLVDKWITFDPNKGRAILYIYAVPERDMKKFRVVFRQRALNELRERHTWFSVFQCSPRSPFTRAQRVTCAFSVLVAAMLSNIMFFGTNPSSDNNIDKGEYTIIGITIDVKSIVIGLESSLLAYPFGFVVVQLFSLIKPRVSDEDEVNQLIEEAHWEMRAESIGSVAPSFMSGISRDSLESLTSQQKRTLYHFEGSTETITEFNKSFWSERQLNISETSLDIENVPSCFNEDNADVEVSKSLFNHGDYLYPAPMRTRMDFSPREYEFNAKEVPKLESHHFVFYLPWWFIYISWTLTILLTLLCTYFIMLYGLTYGYKKSMEWFASDIISFAESNVLLDPLQVLIVLIVSCYLVEFLRARQGR